jgi:hypothetical protein
MTRDRHLPLPARSSFACVRASQLLVLLPLAMSQRLPLALRDRENNELVSRLLNICSKTEIAMEHGSAQTFCADQGIKLLFSPRVEYLLARTDIGTDIGTPLTCAALTSV